jgi:PAS domain S-box-containing protein
MPGHTVKPAEREEQTSMTAGPPMTAVPADFVREEAQASLARSESSARRHSEGIGPIYDSAHIGLCVLDRDLRFVHINAHLAQINGIAADEHIGRTVREVLPALADALEPGLRRVIDTGEAAHDVEVSGETSAQPGVRRIFTESWLPLRDASGEIVGINIVAKEITDVHWDVVRINDPDKLERRPVALRGLVQQAVDDVRPAITERRHRLVVDLPEPGIAVDGEPVRLSQILLNLLLNAANNTQEGARSGSRPEYVTRRWRSRCRTMARASRRTGWSPCSIPSPKANVATWSPPAGLAWASTSPDAWRSCTGGEWRRTVTGRGRARRSACACRA